jgi:hypothetical protein
VPTECVYVFHVILIMDSDCFPKQYKATGTCSLFPMRQELNVLTYGLCDVQAAKYRLGMSGCSQPCVSGCLASLIGGVSAPSQHRADK